MEYTGFSALHNAGAKSLFACTALAIGGAAFDGGRRLRTELAPNSLTVFRLRASL